MFRVSINVVAVVVVVVVIIIYKLYTNLNFPSSMSEVTILLTAVD